MSWKNSLCTYIIFIYLFLGSKSVMMRKVIRNGQPEETEMKKEMIKVVESKIQKMDVVEAEQDKDKRNKLKPSVKPKV